MKRKHMMISHRNATLLALALATGSAMAQTSGTWAIIGSGNWDTASNWTITSGIGTVPDGVGATASYVGTFSSTTNTLTMGTSRTLGILTLGSNKKTQLSRTGSATLTMDNTGSTDAEINLIYADPPDNSQKNSTTINVPLLLNDNLNIKSNLAAGTGETYTFSNTSTFSTATSGLKTLTNMISHGGSVTINGIISDGSGTLAVQQNSVNGFLALGAANIYSGTTKSTAGVLRLNHLLAIQNSALDTTGSGTVTANAGVGTYVMGGLITGRDLASVVTGTQTNVTTLTLNPGTGKSNTYNNVIGNLGPNMTLTKTGAGTQILGGTNTYTGATNVKVGKLSIGSTGTINTSSGVTIGTASTAAVSEFNYNSATTLSQSVAFAADSTGGTLSGSGTIGAVTITSGNSLSPGNSIGKFTSGALTFNTGSTFTYEMDHTWTTGGDITKLADLQIVNGNLNLPTSGTANLILTDTAAFTPNTTTLSLIQYTGMWNSGFFTYGGNVLDNYEEFDDARGNHWKITYNSTASGANFKPGSDAGFHFVTLSNLTAVPEPGSLLALGCLIGSGAFLRSRRRGAEAPVVG